VSQPGDRFETQADAVAARVGLGDAPAGPPPAVARLAAPSAAADDPGPPGLAALLANPGPGAPIPPDVRAQIEPHLGFALGDVQVHGNGAAQTAAAQLGARAFTAGGHIFLGTGESATDLPLMAHEATHVVQQQAVGVFRLQRSSDGILPDFIMDGVRDLARSVPGYDMLTVVAGYDPIANRTVDRSPENLVRGVMGLVPFGNVVANKLLELRILQDAFRMIDAGLTARNLTLERIQREIDQAWDELSIDKGIDGNVAVVTRHVDGLYRDALAFVRDILDQVVQLIRDAAVGLAETYLVGSPVWELTKKVLHHDPLRGTPVAAPTVEILADFLTLIGKQQALAQMQERGTLQKTADWLDVQLPRFLSLISELFALFEAGWHAIQPENLANLTDNLGKLARDAIALVQRVGAFASEVVGTVLKLIKDALLDWLSREAAGTRGFRLLTVILGQDPFTGRAVPRTAENLIGGFIALLPGGEETYRKLAEAGVIADAAAQIEGAMSRLGISLDMITGTFLSIWNSLTLEDLLNPIGAFMRVLDKFGEPLGRIVAFAGEVLKVVITLILKLMNFPSELLGSIISNAMAAIEDIQRDPVAFLLNMIAALKAGFVNFLDKVLGYLLSGLADWLFRGLGALGIQKPPDLSFKSILELVLQVLDITVEKLWTKLGKHIGAEVVQKIRAGIGMAGEAFDFIKDIQENGIAAIWKHVESQLGNLWDTLLNMAKDWIVTTIIEKATAKLLSMLDPTGIMAVVNSGIAFFNAVQSVIEYAREILAIVNDYVSTLAAVAAGNIAAGAGKVERGLANAIPVAIGFLANQAGLGNVPEKVVELIGHLRELVDAALDWLFEQAKRLGQAALNALGFGGDAGQQAGPDQPAPAAASAGEIPAGLPPDEIKRLILDMVQSSVGTGQLTSIAQVHQYLNAIFAANKDRGLHGLTAKVPDPRTMEVVFEASASAAVGRRIAWRDIFSQSEIDTNKELEDVRKKLSEASMASYAAVAVTGAQVGAISSSGGGEHAEERVVTGATWQKAIEAARKSVADSGSATIAVMINRSPCISCVAHLKDAIKEAQQALGADAARVTFLLAATGTYRRQARIPEEDRKLLEEAAKKEAAETGRPFDEIFKREEEFWKEDLRSYSTEFEDKSEGTTYSGLGELSAAGWQVAGLDAGQPIKPRQIEMAQISAKLAETMTKA
jgi:hypothetical protein